jgi:hypothetical protein
MFRRANIKIAEGSHQAIATGELSVMITEWAEITDMNDQALLSRHGKDARRKLVEVLPTLVYARISKSAWSLSSLAGIENAMFDPVEFGRRCEAIAREQIERYRTLAETAGRA